MKRRIYPGLTGAVTDPNDEMFSFLDHFHTLILAASIIQKTDITLATQAIHTIKAALTGLHAGTRPEQEELCGALFDLLFAVKTVGYVAQETASATAKLQQVAQARLIKQAKSRMADSIIRPIVKDEWNKNRNQRTANRLAQNCFDQVQEALQAGRKSGHELPNIGLDALRKRIKGYLDRGLLDSRPADNRMTEQSSY